MHTHDNHMEGDGTTAAPKRTTDAQDDTGQVKKKRRKEQNLVSDQSGKYFIGLNLTNVLCQTGIGGKRPEALLYFVYLATC